MGEHFGGVADGRGTFSVFDVVSIISVVKKCNNSDTHLFRLTMIGKSAQIILDLDPSGHAFSSREHAKVALGQLVFFSLLLYDRQAIRSLLTRTWKGDNHNPTARNPGGHPHCAPLHTYAAGKTFKEAARSAPSFALSDSAAYNYPPSRPVTITYRSINSL